jgi:uncharacterized Zn finger protein
MTTHCTRCGRTLTNPDSIAAGMGHTCARRTRQEQAAKAAEVKPDTMAKALEDLEDGAVQPTTRTTSTGHRIYVAASSDGRGWYLATEAACTCRAGHRGRMCRHRVAALLSAAA